MAKFNMNAFKNAQNNKTGVVTKISPSELIPEGVRELIISDAKESKKGKGIILYLEDTEIKNGRCFFYVGYEDENNLAVLMTIADEINLPFTIDTPIAKFKNGKFKAIIEHNNDDVKYTKDGEKTVYELPKTLLGGKMTEEQAIAAGWVKEPNPRAELKEVLTSNSNITTDNGNDDTQHEENLNPLDAFESDNELMNDELMNADINNDINNDLVTDTDEDIDMNDVDMKDVSMEELL